MAFDEAQRDRAASRLLAAQQRLIECARPACGSALMSECTRMYTEVEQALPSVVLSARDEASNTDLTAVDVTLNGKPFAPMLDGRPISIDPGEHEFVFSAVGQSPIRRRAMIGTGDKYRLINVVFPAGDPARLAHAPAPAATVSAVATPGDTPPSREIPPMSWVLGGVGVVGLGTFGVLRVVASSDYDTLEKGCAAEGCPQSDLNNLKQKYLFSHVALGVGGAAMAGAVLWYFFDTPSPDSTSVAVLPAPHGDGALATARGTF